MALITVYVYGDNSQLQISSSDLSSALQTQTDNLNTHPNSSQSPTPMANTHTVYLAISQYLVQSLIQ